jgi:adenylate cyclase
MNPQIHNFFNLSTDLLSIRNQIGYFVELNHGWTTILGWEIEELKSRPWLDFIHPDDVAVTQSIDLKCQGISQEIPAQEILKITNRFRSKNGNYRWLSWRFSPYNDNYSYGITKDVTNSKWNAGIIYQNDIQQALNLRDKAIEASSVGIVIADAQLSDMPLIYVNSAFENITGYSAVDVLGENCRFLQGENKEQPSLKILRKTIKEGKNCTVTLLNYRKDGTPFWNELSISPIYNDEYKLTHFVGVQNDVTERVKTQEALNLRDKAIEASSVGIVIADAQLPDMPLIYINSAFEKMTGYSREETIGKNCRFLQGKNTSQATIDQLRKAIKEETNCTVILLNYHKNGTPFWNELTISPIYNLDNKLTHFVGIQNDVTTRISADKALKLEKLKSERLLLNILPKQIVQRLKEVHNSVAQQFESATILFADIVGFTSLSVELRPLELISLLNEIFSAFDRLVDKHEVEKIKTIGDAYMVAGGIPLPQENHIRAIAQMALDMQEAIKHFQKSKDKPFEIRIGINTGSVVAGVIGQKKFIYDLWGDAVNVASRMESHGKAGKIQVTEVVYQALNDQFIFEKRGLINIKGKGQMTTYWLLGKK